MSFENAVGRGLRFPTMRRAFDEDEVRLLQSYLKYSLHMQPIATNINRETCRPIRMVSIQPNPPSISSQYPPIPRLSLSKAVAAAVRDPDSSQPAQELTHKLYKISFHTQSALTLRRRGPRTPRESWHTVLCPKSCSAHRQYRMALARASRPLVVRRGH